MPVPEPGGYGFMPLQAGKSRTSLAPMGIPKQVEPLYQWPGFVKRVQLPVQEINAVCKWGIPRGRKKQAASIAVRKGAFCGGQPVP